MTLARAAGIANGEWGEEPASLGLRRMGSDEQWPHRRFWLRSQVLPPPLGFRLLSLFYMRNSCGNRNEGMWLIEGEASLETGSVDDT